MWQFWLIAAGIFFIAEIITVGFLVFWLGIGALLAMVTSFITDSLMIQFTVFVISSALMLFFTKPFVQKYISKTNTTRTNAFSIIGKQGVVIEDIDQANGTGQINLSGDIWSAKSEEEIIKKGTEVEVVSIEGVKAKVKPIRENEIIHNK